MSPTKESVAGAGAKLGRCLSRLPSMTWILAYLLAGTVIGFFAGLLGIGGGMTLVPILAALFTAQQMAPEHVIHPCLL